MFALPLVCGCVNCGCGNPSPTNTLLSWPLSYITFGVGCLFDCCLSDDGSIRKIVIKNRTEPAEKLSKQTD